MKSKRPWKRHACIRRVELNSGDVQFAPYRCESQQGVGKVMCKHNTPFTERHKGNVMWTFGSFESLDGAIADLDAWWADWWPKQIKSSRRA